MTYLFTSLFFRIKKNLGKQLKIADISLKMGIFPIFKMSLSSPHGAWAFDELLRYHTRPLRFNWGHGNVHFGKMHFREPKYRR